MCAVVYNYACSFPANPPPLVTATNTFTDFFGSGGTDSEIQTPWDIVLSYDYIS